MGCWVTKNSHGTMTFICYWKGRKWWESSGEMFEDPKVRKRGKGFAKLVAASMDAGTFPVDYERFFPRGNRLAEFAATKATGFDGAVFLREFAALFLRERQSRAYRSNYGRALKTSVTRWIVPELGHYPLTELKREHVIAFRDRILETPKKRGAGKCSLKYAENIVTHLQAMLTEAVKRKLIEENPAHEIEWPRRPKQQIDPYTAAEVERILGYLRKHWPLDYRLALCLADTGMRPSEATGLEWGHVELSGEGMIQIHQSHTEGEVNATKTVASERTIAPISPRLLRVLADARPLHAKATDPVFVGPTGRRINQERFRARKFVRAIAALKVRPRKRPVYNLRHTFISLALSARQPVQWVAEYIGDDAATMQEHYAKFIPPSDHDPLGWVGKVVDPAGEGLPGRGAKSPARQRIAKG